MTDEEIKEIEDALNAASPGKWRWRGNLKTKQVCLASGEPRIGWFEVLGFTRWGMQGGQPRLRGIISSNDHFMQNLSENAEQLVKADHNSEFRGINQPDMHIIENATLYIRKLLDEVKRLKGEVK